MPNNKYLKLQNQLTKSIKEIFYSSSEYNRFLQTAAYQFRLGFSNAAVIFLQEPKATALLTYDSWKRYGRVPKRYSKSIYAFSNAPGRYLVLFDYSKTVVDKRITKYKELKFFDYKDELKTVNAMKVLFFSDNNDLQTIIFTEAAKQANNVVTQDSYDTEIDFIAKTVTNMMMYRFGKEMPYTDILGNINISKRSLSQAAQRSIDVFHALYSRITAELPNLIAEQEKADTNEKIYVVSSLGKVSFYTDSYNEALENYTLRKSQNEKETELLVTSDYSTYETLIKNVSENEENISNDVSAENTSADGESDSELTEHPAYSVTQNDIDSILTSGTSYESGKIRIYSAYAEQQPENRIISLLKKEYTSTGKILTAENGTRHSVSFVSEGMAVSGLKQGCEAEALFTYEQIYARIGELIAQNRYLTPDELIAYEAAVNTNQNEVDVVKTSDQETIDRFNRKPEDGSNTPDDFSTSDIKEHTLEYYDRTHEDKSLPFLGGDKIIKAVLLSATRLSATKAEIEAFFESEPDKFKQIQFIRNVFHDDPTEFVIPDGRTMGYKKFRNVLQLWEGSYSDRTSQGFYDWGIIAGYYDGMRLIGELRDTPPVFSFTREIIDAVLTRGSGVSGGKLRIYQQLQSSLSKTKNIAFLKKEYGIGGAYPIIIGTDIDEQHDGKGIKLRHEGTNKTILLSWSQVENRISVLIKQDRYLSRQKKAHYSLQGIESDSLPAPDETVGEIRSSAQNLVFQYSVGDSVYINSTPYTIAAIENDAVNVYQTNSPLFQNTYDREEFEDLLKTYISDNTRLIAANPVSDSETETAYKAGGSAESAAEVEAAAEKFSEYIYFRPRNHDVSLVCFKPDGNNGSGQIVHKSIDAKELAAAISTLNINTVQEYIDNHSRQITVDTHDSDEFTEFLEGIKNEKHFVDITSDSKTYDSFKQALEEYAKAVSVYEKPRVIINWSEHPALAPYIGKPLRFSFANELLGRLDMLENAKREDPGVGHYYKTDFNLYSTENGVTLDTYNGRYDLADGETDIVTHIENYKDFARRLHETTGEKFDEAQFDILTNRLRIALKNNPLTEVEKSQIESVVTAEYGLDAEESAAEASSGYSDLIDKEVVYSDKTFRIKSINQFHQASLEDISSLSEGLIPIDTVLPAETVRNLLEAQGQKHGENYVITDSQIGAGTPLQRFQNNVNAITVLQKLQKENRAATQAEQNTMAQYVGWGGLADFFNENNARYSELKALLSPSDYRSANDSVLTSFYTPPIVIKAIYSALTSFGFTNGSILDPACGTGHFFGMIPEHLKNGTRLYGIELDSISGNIAKALYPNANIKIQGFETTGIPENYIDIAVGNVPFGDYRVSDKAYNKHHLLIHDYFFVKTLDKVRPGGIVAFITSKGTMDKQNTKVRKMLAEKADLIGAFRLPNNTFKTAAGTEVTSDIIFLQKKTSAEIITEYPDWVNTTEIQPGVTVNNYFLSHPEMICGKLKTQTTRFKVDSVCVPDSSKTLSELLNTAVSRLSCKYEPYTVTSNENEEQANSIAADEHARNYSYFFKDGTLYYRENGRMTISKYSGKKQDRIAAMVNLTDVTRELITAEADGASDQTVTDLRAKLNAAYDGFVEEYGSLNSYANSIFKSDNSYSLLCSLEVITTDEVTEEIRADKADIFFKRTISPKVEITHADTPEEALIISVSRRGTVDLAYMSELTDSTEDFLIEQLNGSSIFHDPYTNKYVTADEYLSGNVREKLTRALTAASYDKKYQINVKALEAVQPKDIPASEISVRLGTTWIPVEYYNQFMKEVLNSNKHSGIKIEFNSLMGNYYITNKGYDNFSVESINKYGLKERNAYRILEDCLNLKNSEVKDSVYIGGKTKSVLNKEKTVLAQSKQELIKAKFTEWIFKDPSRRRQLTRLYNDSFNAIVPRSYDGSNLTFPGMNPNIQLRQHQLNAIARTLYGGNALLAHQVGAGKTFEMIASAMKAKELGLAHKSLICVPKHLTSQTGAEFLRLYPAANILVAEEKDFTPQNRKRFCTRIATGDYDAIIIGHTQLDKIPLKPETQAAIFNEQLEEIMTALETARRDSSAGATVKSLVRTRKAVENKLKELKERTSNKDDVICFEELGVDRIFIDEAHLFKNLYIYTKMTNVSGIGSGKESGRASDLYSKICYLNRISPGRGIVFATGTPISNTMSEMYTMQRYLQPQLLKSMGLNNFDSWATTFGETVTALEISPDGNGYKAKTRFAKFNNIPELMSMFKEIADVQTAETLKLPVPEVKREIVNVEPTDEQKHMIELLGERSEEIQRGNVDPRDDNILKIISEGKCIALDPQIMNPYAVPGNKVSACVQNVFNIWRQSGDKTQLIFCDLSTPSVKKGKSSKSSDYCVYDDIKNRLVSLGIPANEIQFAQTHNNAKAKKKLYADVREGKVRILIGSTETLGTGANIQTKLIALHHLDCPNRPSDLEQREGRIIRQGNENKTVTIHNYVTKGTFDAFMYQMVERKQKFISSVMTAKHFIERSADDIDEATLNYGQIKAVASDNPLVIEKFEIDSKVNRLSSIRNNFINEHREMEDEVQLRLPKEIKRLEALIKCLEDDLAFAQAHPFPENYEIEIGGVLYSKRTDAWKAIVKEKQNLSSGGMQKIGTLRGFSVCIYQEDLGFFSKTQLSVRNILNYKTDFDISAGTGNLIRLENVIEHDITEKLEEAQDDLSRAKNRLEAASAEMNQPFPQEAEYQDLLVRQAKINAMLTVPDTPSSNNVEVDTDNLSAQPSNEHLTKPIRR